MNVSKEDFQLYEAKRSGEAGKRVAAHVSALAKAKGIPFGKAYGIARSEAFNPPTAKRDSITQPVTSVTPRPAPQRVVLTGEDREWLAALDVLRAAPGNWSDNSAEERAWQTFIHSKAEAKSRVPDSLRHAINGTLADAGIEQERNGATAFSPAAVMRIHTAVDSLKAAILPAAPKTLEATRAAEDEALSNMADQLAALEMTGTVTPATK